MVTTSLCATCLVFLVLQVCTSRSSTVVYGKHVVDVLGRHCCLWCHIRTDQLKTPPTVHGPILLRSSESIVEDYKRFIEAGGNIKKAKAFNNCIYAHHFPPILIFLRYAVKYALNIERMCMCVDCRSVRQDYTSPWGFSIGCLNYLKRHAMSWT